MGIKRVLVRELRRIYLNPRYLIILTLGIVFTFVFFATMTKEGQPRRLSVAVVDMDGSYLSRRICHELNSTPGVEVVAVYTNHTEARKAMQRGKIFAFYEIPKGTYNDLLQFRAPHFVLYVNSAYMLAGTLSYKQLSTMAMMATGAVQREIYRKKGYSEQQIMGLILPIGLDTRYIGNPWVGYGCYLMTTLIPAVIAFIALMHAAYVISREREERTLRSWIRRANGKTLNAFIGKLLPYFVWYTFLLILSNLIMFGYMGFPMDGSWMLMVANSILLVYGAQCLGAFFAGCIPEAPFCMSLSAIFSALSFSLSGFSFPADSMPRFFQALANLYPIRHYFLNFSNIAIFGNGFEHCWPNFCAMMALGILLIIGAFMLDWQVKEVKVETGKHAEVTEQKFYKRLIKILKSPFEM